jgi:hypothetical protein
MARGTIEMPPGLSADLSVEYAGYYELGSGLTMLTRESCTQIRALFL